MKKEYILAVDQGTSGTKSVIFDSDGRIAAKASVALRSYYPQPGFVEQEPLEIYENVLLAVRDCLSSFEGRISSCGISNQRETFLIWDEKGQPLSKAVVWQCKRSVEVCKALKSSGIEKDVTARTGLIIDPYFSGTKLVWLYENDDHVRNAIDRGSAFFGTIDTWLLYKLTGGKRYATDYTNACRTLFFNIKKFFIHWNFCII